MKVLLFALLGVCNAVPNIWPLPQTYTNGTATVAVNPGLVFSVSSPSSDLSAAVARFVEEAFVHRGKPSGVATAKVTVNTAAELQLDVDESYELNVTDSGIVISAATQFGVYHALETLSQLIHFNFDTLTYEVQSCPWSISDYPRFSHREVLIDAARDFIGVPQLKRIIRSLTYAKLNTVHWHIVDDQSFPYGAPSYPKLAKGAYSVYERYSDDDVKDVVEYARLRGVRVVVEVDTPGHAASWCKGHPEVCPSATCVTPLNPAVGETFAVVEGVFSDLSAATIDNHFHIGGDEVNTKCWTQTPSIAVWMKQQNMTADQTYGYFSGKVAQIAFNLSKTVVAWEELWNHFGTALDKRTVIQQWLPGSTIVGAATAAGYKVIWSTDGVWYLDNVGTTWEAMYSAEPCTNLTDTQCALVIGGGGEMWGESAGPSNVEMLMWPRLAAVAERLWSSRATTDTTTALQRLKYFRCLLDWRGVPASSAVKTPAGSNPHMGASCYDQ